MPQIARSVVVLPAPLAPSSAVTPPSADGEVDAVQHAASRRSRRAAPLASSSAGMLRLRIAEIGADHLGLVAHLAPACRRRSSCRIPAPPPCPRRASPGSCDARPAGCSGRNAPRMRCSSCAELVHLAVVEAAGRFVQQQQLGRADQCARQLDALLRAERQAAGRHVGDRAAGPAGPAGRPAARPPPGPPAARTGRRSALARKPERPRWCAPTSTLSRTVRVRNSATFWKVRPMPRPAMRWRGIPVSDRPSNSDVASRVAVDAADAVEQRGLAGAVRADQAADLAVADVEGHAVQRDHAAEAHLDTGDPQQRPVRV